MTAYGISLDFDIKNTVALERPWPVILPKLYAGRSGLVCSTIVYRRPFYIRCLQPVAASRYVAVG
eukprot:scaffold661572_cov103-Prasinocladus_malaysianus.AAC.1